jgi:hypothetical protein
MSFLRLQSILLGLQIGLFSSIILSRMSMTLLNLYTFLYNKTSQMHQFHKFTPVWNSTCFGQFLCPSSAVYSLYTRHWYTSCRFVDSFRAGTVWSCSKVIYRTVWHIPLPSVQWINSWWWAEELSKICRFSCQNKFVNLVHLVGFIIKKK